MTRPWLPLLLSLILSASVLGERALPAIGAIRWDAWYGAADSTGAYVERVLSLPQWRYRLPFFAVEVNATVAVTDGNSSTVMQQELAYAAHYGIDFWAFVAYPPKTHLFYAQQLYLEAMAASGGAANKVRFCLVMDRNELSILARDLPRVVGYFKLPYYQRTPAGRPLVFTFGAIASDAPALAQLRDAARSAGLPAPYVTAMGWGTAAAQATLAQQLGADALSMYAWVPGDLNSHPGRAVPFAESAAAEVAHSEACAAAGWGVVPTITAGWDPRPREALTPPWSQPFPAQCRNDTGGGQCWVQDPTMAELANQTTRVLEWAATSSAAAPSGAVIVSAWNEHDEGHWICPSLRDGPQKLQAIRSGIERARQNPARLHGLNGLNGLSD
eukprot:g478.t1